MGQGLNTKLVQIVAQSFGIPEIFVAIEETSTTTVANSQPTGKVVMYFYFYLNWI
jgi:xanthine dehydrogenase molybdopterin-binding subunit B